MKGIELSEAFYREFGEPMIRDCFPELLGLIAVGVAGSGSECFGYDDELSQDHDFDIGFCIFIPDENVIDSRGAFALERAYSKLPRSFRGFERSLLAPVGGSRRGVIRMSDFFKSKTGDPEGELSPTDWLMLPEQSLAEAVNGKVFFDGLGKFTEIREKLSYMPEDIRRKKLAGELLVMGQSGQYNYGRCIARGETAAAQLAMCDFARSALHAAFLLNKQYMPYYKWSFRALRELPLLSKLHEPLEYLISSANREGKSERKIRIAEQICADIISEARGQGLSDYSGAEAEGHAYSVNGGISSPDIRNLHILCAV
ncbi:MAG: DUF4037 domain-containing protein [Clostridia bacterium]|nr:DUF4037 domain-containing protein [Clostridia bacterium]